MIFHLGIDAGFFTEYTYMLHAMLYCLQHKIQFKLYSDDANFGWEKGWTDCFVPFCEEVHEAFHHTYNTPPAFVESIDEGQEIAQDQTDEMETESNLQEYNRRDSRFPDL